LTILPKIGPDILGYAAQISPDEVVRLTNQKRAEAGLSALVLNTTLSSAAYTKGKDMIEKDYWAHVAPDGTQPWKFFSDFGYKYRYAGENLARDFSNPASAIEAWMNSSTHKENILNPKYKEIGIGVVEGDLAGVDTTIIVQFFGSTYADPVFQPIAEKKAEVSTPEPSLPIIEENNEINSNYISSIDQAEEYPRVQAIVTSSSPQRVLISPFVTTKILSFGVVLFLIFVFIIDSVLIRRRKIERIGGRAFAHVAFLGMVLAIAVILHSGKIL